MSSDNLSIFTDSQADAAIKFLKIMRHYLESICSDLRSHTITNVQSNDRVRQTEVMISIFVLLIGGKAVTKNKETIGGKKPCNHQVIALHTYLTVSLSSFTGLLTS